GEAPAGRAGTSRENLNHSRERRDAVERALRTLHDLDSLDVLDGDLRERRIEWSSHGDAVHGDEEGIELLQAPDPDVRKPRTVVRPASGVYAGNVLERLRDRLGAAPPELVARDHGDGRRNVERVLRTLRRRDDHRRARSGSRGCLCEKRRGKGKSATCKGSPGTRRIH